MPLELPVKFLIVVYRGTAGSTEAASQSQLSLLGGAQQYCQYQCLGQSWVLLRKLIDNVKLSHFKKLFQNFSFKVLLRSMESEFSFHYINKQNPLQNKQKSYIGFFNSYLFSALDLAAWTGKCVSPSFKMSFLWYAEFHLLLLVWFKSEPSKSCKGITFFLFPIFFLALPVFSKSTHQCLLSPGFERARSCVSCTW